MTTTHYAEPTGRMQRGFNDLVAWLSARGVGLAGARTLTVVGRKSGTPQTTPVNPLVIEGRTYLISPRGNTQWSRNLRVAGVATIGHGRRSDEFRATEVDDAAKIALLRPYLKRWGWEVASYLPAKVSHTSSDAELAAIAPAVPVFELHRVDAVDQ